MAFHLQATDYSVPYANKLFCEKFGSPEGRMCYDLMHRRKEPCEPCNTFEIFETGETRSSTWNASDGRVYHTVATPFKDIDGTQLIMEMAIDITDQKKAEDEIRKNEADLAQAQKIARLGNWTLDIQKNTLRWSDETFHIFGVSPQSFEATYEAFLKRVHPEDLELVKRSVDGALKDRKPYNIEHRVVLPDGSERVVQELAQVDYNDSGEPIKMNGTVQDITEQKKAEEELIKSREQLRELCSHLENIREEERTRIAREVHDELGQKLTALNYDLSGLKKGIHADKASFLEKIQSMSSLVANTLASVQKICTELRPEVLDVLGLSEAIEWQAQEFLKKTGIEYEVELHPEHIFLDEDRSTTVFRIFQETLTNVARHANASKVCIRMKKNESHFFLEVQDNGRGFNADESGRTQSLGLIGMRERALIWGGEIHIKGVQGEGTTVNLTIPNGSNTH